MNIQSRVTVGISDLLPKLLKVIVLMSFITLTSSAVLAQAPRTAAWKATGEIVSASKTTINGFSAVSGATVFNNNHIRTGKEGAAVINLGRLGRIQLGPDTDMTLRISESSIGGELRSSQMVVSAQKGVAITVNTAEGLVTTDGLEPAVLTIYLDGKRPRVITHRGVANVATTDGNGLGRGKESASSSRGDELRRAGLVPGVAGVAAVSQTTIYAVTRGSNSTPFFRLFKAGVDYSTGSKPNGSNAGNSFDSSITCQNDHQPNCHKKSSPTPQ